MRSRRRRRLGGLEAARHSRKKIEKLMFPTPIHVLRSRPTLKLGPERGMHQRHGKMSFMIKRSTEYSPSWPIRSQVSKQPYTAMVCIGGYGGQKMRSRQFDQHGSVSGCGMGGGSTPTKALADGMRSLARQVTQRGWPRGLKRT